MLSTNDSVIAAENYLLKKDKNKGFAFDTFFYINTQKEFIAKERIDKWILRKMLLICK